VIDKPSLMSDIISSQSCAIGGLRITLDLLKALADDLHVPGLKSVVGAAVKIIEIIDV
jgi:hypothetical protein